MNIFTRGEEISKLVIQSSKNYYSFQSAANLSISENILKNCSPKIASSKNCFLKKVI